MIKQPIRISLPVFWTWVSSKNFYKINKSYNRPPEMDQHYYYYQIIISLDDMLIMRRTLPEILVARDRFIFLLRHLGLVINLKISVPHPVKQIEFLSFVVDIEIMTLALSEKKWKHVSQQ